MKSETPTEVRACSSMAEQAAYNRQIHVQPVAGRFHEPSVGITSDWYTPPEIFDALGLVFDLDPCSPFPLSCHVPARHVFNSFDDGLKQPWRGLVFMNPPFGGRNGHVPWLRKFLAHGNGVAIARAYTSSAWFHEWAVNAETMLFPKGKTKFIRPNGEAGKSPGHGVVLLGMGVLANEALRASGLGFYVNCKAKAPVSSEAPEALDSTNTKV